MTVKKANTTKYTLQEARRQVNECSFSDHLRFNGCKTPLQLHLLIIFRMIRETMYKNANADEKHRINYQQALFERAQEIEWLREKTGLVK